MNKREVNLKSELTHARDSLRKKFKKLHNLRTVREQQLEETFTPITSSIDRLVHNTRSPIAKSGTARVKIESKRENISPEEDDVNDDDDDDYDVAVVNQQDEPVGINDPIHLNDDDDDSFDDDDFYSNVVPNIDFERSVSLPSVYERVRTESVKAEPDAQQPQQHIAPDPKQEYGEGDVDAEEEENERDEANEEVELKFNGEEEDEENEAKAENADAEKQYKFVSDGYIDVDGDGDDFGGRYDEMIAVENIGHREYPEKSPYRFIHHDPLPRRISAGKRKHVSIDGREDGINSAKYMMNNGDRLMKRLRKQIQTNKDDREKKLADKAKKHRLDRWLAVCDLRDMREKGATVSIEKARNHRRQRAIFQANPEEEDTRFIYSPEDYNDDGKFIGPFPQRSKILSPVSTVHPAFAKVLKKVRIKRRLYDKGERNTHRRERKRPPKQAVSSSVVGKGLEEAFIPYTSNIAYEYYDDPNELCERLFLLISSKAAGNTNHDQEINSIIEELRESNIIE